MAAGTSYRVFSPEVWSPFLKVYFKDKLFAAKFFMDFSGELEAQGGDMISVPNLTKGMEGTSLTTTTGDITDYTFGETRTQITVNNWIYASRKFSDFELMRIAGNYNLQNRYLKEDIAPQLAISFDKALIGQSGQATNIQLHTGTSIVALSNTAITESLRIAESYSLPLEEMAFWFHPNTYWKDLFRRTALIDASQLGKALIASPVGDIHPLGSLYGVPCFVTNLVGACTGIGGDAYPQTSHRNLLIHPRAIAFAFGNTGGGRGTPRLQTLPVANALASRIIGDLAYGTATPGKFEGVRLIGNS